MFYFSGIPATAAPFEPRRVHSRSLRRTFFFVSRCWGLRRQSGFLGKERDSYVAICNPQNDRTAGISFFTYSTTRFLTCGLPPSRLGIKSLLFMLSTCRRFAPRCFTQNDMTIKLSLRGAAGDVGVSPTGTRLSVKSETEILTSRLMTAPQNDTTLSLRCRAHARPWESRLPTEIKG